MARASSSTTRLFAQSAERGALPQLKAVLDPGVAPGAYLGPDGPGAMRGWPTLETPSRRARNPELARAVWDLSERLTGVSADLAG